MYETMLNSAVALIEKHNENLSKTGVEFEGLKLDIENFKKSLIMLGATTQERCASLSYEDILDCLKFVDVKHELDSTTVKPKLLAKDIAKIFRGKQETTEVVDTSPSSKKVKNLTKKQLVSLYDPKNLDETDSVNKRLLELSKNQAFLVFNKDGSVNVDISTKLLEELTSGYQSRQFFNTPDDIYQVYKLGEYEAFMADENPMYPNRPLRPDGTCDQTGRSYDGISLDVRQFMRLLIQSHHFDGTLGNINNILDVAVGTDAFSKLSKTYPQVYLTFKKLEKDNQLPKLKISLKKKVSALDGGVKVKNL